VCYFIVGRALIMMMYFALQKDRRKYFENFHLKEGVNV
jgi:hypothetical protein